MEEKIVIKKTERYYDFLSSHDSYAETVDTLMKVAIVDDGHVLMPYRKIESNHGCTEWFRCSYSVECPKANIRVDNLREI